MDPLQVDPKSPLPLYHQIATGVRYQIATGRIAPGTRLPPVREAAAAWGVHFHTVRRAYSELARRGLVTVSGRHGTRTVSAPSGRREPDDLTGFLRRMLSQAEARFGLTPSELEAHLARTIRARRADGAEVSVVECNRVQCEELAEDVLGSWDVVVRPWCLAEADEPPAGPILATYFHLDEIAGRWPHRLSEIHFISIRPDPSLRDRVGRRRTTRILLIERDREMARLMANDIKALLPAEFQIVPKVPAAPARVLRAVDPDAAVLFAPRVWNDLDDEVRRDPRALQVRYSLDPRELTAIAKHLGWKARRHTPRMARLRGYIPCGPLR